MGWNHRVCCVRTIALSSPGGQVSTSSALGAEDLLDLTAIVPLGILRTELGLGDLAPATMIEMSLTDALRDVASFDVKDILLLQ